MTEADVTAIRAAGVELAPTIAECEPDLDVLDEYQTTVQSQIIYDAGGKTLRGKNPLRHMHDGLHEEIGETVGQDKLNPGYSRLGALFQLPTLHAGTVTPLARTLHQKEFGDISWYKANFLTMHGLTLSEAVEAGRERRAYEAKHAPKCSPEFVLDAERVCPALFYLGYSHEFLEAADRVVEKDSRSRREVLAQTAGKLILSMSHIAVARLETTYENILQQNLEKINARIANGTIHDKTGGDTR